MSVLIQKFYGVTFERALDDLMYLPIYRY